MIVWGGLASDSSLGPIYSAGGRYNAATDAWSPTNITGAPSARDGHTAVWTGTEMIVWGGNYTASGGRYCVTADPGFDISAAPTALIVTQGASSSTVITVSSFNVFSSAVSLSCQGAPAGVTWSFAPNPATPPANGSTSSTLTLVVGANAVSGTYWFPVVATSGSLSRSFMLQLGVLASSDFSVDCYPEIVSAQQGASTSTTPRLWSQNGFNLPVTMSCSGAPAGVTFSFFFNPVAPPPGGSVTNDMTISVAASVPPGIYDFQVVGMSGALVRTFPMQLTVLPSACLYDLSPIYSDTFTESGGSGSVTVTTSPGCSWQAASNADWITITAGANGVGTGTVNYTVAPKPDSGARFVRMTIAGQTYQIYQLGAACPYAIAPTSHSFTAAGWTGVVNVAAPGPCSWTATSNASWITVLATSTTNGAGSVTYSVTPNTGASPRSGSITIAGLTFTVNEAGAAGTCVSSLSPPEQYCPTNGGNWSVNINAPSGCAWTAFSNANWISITRTGCGAGNGVLDYGVASNPSPATPRTGTITIGDKTLTVYQSLALLPPNGTDTIGVYFPGARTFYLRNNNSQGLADMTIQYGPAGAKPLVGDWNGDSVATIGVYDPTNQTFYLRNNNTAGFADLTIKYGPAGAIPVVGDWDGDGVTTIGVYDSTSRTFYLRNSNTPGFADLTIQYGPAGATPVVGDWDANRTTTTGVYDPGSRTFYLRNSNTIGFADLTIQYGPAGATPVVGDWDGNGTVTIGVYDPASQWFYLRNSNSVGFADLTIRYGPSGATPLVGNWDGL